MDFRTGISWYPELHDESEWARDLSNMRAAGLRVLRMFDFAWSAMEPREGDYRLDWVGRCLDMAHAEGFGVVFCTPTASPPRWLGEQFPQIMIELADGRRRPMGARRDACVSSPIYRHFCGELAGRLGREFSGHPAVEGWQIDNELIGPEYAPPECHCPECQWRFRDFLKKKYGSPCALNAAWGTRFWSHEFSDWGEVTTPRHFRCMDGHVIEYGRFFTGTISEFIAVQADRLRPHLRPGQWIGHNATGVFDRQIDHRAIQRGLDIAGWDAYQGAAGGPHPAARTGLAHELFRSTQHRPFLVYETGAGRESLSGSHWGEMRARGASTIIAWHFRRHRSGVESGGDMLADYDGTPLPGRIRQAAALERRLADAGPLQDSFPCQTVAFVFSQDMIRLQHRPKPRWDEPWSLEQTYLGSVSAFYEPLWRNGVRVDVLGPDDEINEYRVVILPADELVSLERVRRLRDFVAGGGELVVSGRFALRSSCGIYRGRMEEELAELLGARLAGHGVSVELDGWSGIAHPVGLANGELGNPLVPHTNAIGPGHFTHVPNECPQVVQSALRMVCIRGGVEWFENPIANTCVVRDGERLWLINHNPVEAAILGHTVPAEDFRIVEKMRAPIAPQSPRPALDTP
jgi:beta-galactosidase